MSINIQVCSGRNPRAATVIAELLATESDFGVRHCSGCQAGAGNGQADVLIMATGLAGPEELDQIAATRQRHPEIYFIVLSLCDDWLFRETALAAGADWFMLLDDTMPALVNLLRAHHPQSARLQQVAAAHPL